MLDPTVQNSIIGAASAIAVALIARKQITTTISRRKRRRLAETGPDEREAVEAFADDPAQFAKLVMQRLKATEGEVAALKKELAGFRKAERTFRIALARWVAKILDEWGQAAEMPLPDEEDREILADVVPAALEATRPRIPKTKEENDDERYAPRRPRRH